MDKEEALLERMRKINISDSAATKRGLQCGGAYVFVPYPELRKYSS